MNFNYFFVFLCQKRPTFTQILTVLKSMNGDGGLSYYNIDIFTRHVMLLNIRKRFGMSNGMSIKLVTHIRLTKIYQHLSCMFMPMYYRLKFFCVSANLLRSTLRVPWHGWVPYKMMKCSWKSLNSFWSLHVQ